MNDFKFVPKQWVLVRDVDNEILGLNIFSNFRKTALADCYYCVSGWYKQCIPYEGNEKLLGTSNPYVEQWKPKDGDFVTSSSGFPFIYKDFKQDNKSGLYGCYLGMYAGTNYLHIGISKTWTTSEGCQPATEEEKQSLLSELHEIGKDWETENKKVIDYK